MVLSSELLSDFNRWLSGRGLKEWGDRTFTARFAEHEEVAANHVEKRKIRKQPGLKRSTHRFVNYADEAPLQYDAWLGMRFREDDDPLPGEPENDFDQSEHGAGTGGTANLNLSTYVTRVREGSNEPSQPSHSRKTRPERGF